MKRDLQQFAQEVYAIVRLIPTGRVTTYGTIAKALAQEGQARLVGRIMSASPEDVPAHRVVNSTGVLTGHAFFGGDRMAMLLRAEGVPVKGNRVQKFKTFFWNPLLEL